MFGGYKSSVIAPRFFFSPQGSTNPKAELLAAIQAYESPAQLFGTQKQPAACIFPARKRVLEGLLGRHFPDPSCPDLIDWLKRLDADQVSLVYVGAYTGNPASILGHTFLRFSNRAKEASGREGLDLLSYSVAFMAQTDPRDGRLTYVVKGITGGYPASYEIEPHYMKVGLYNNSESRDLWDLKLKLSRDEVQLLAMHLWEFTFNASLRYYFIDENCSYRLIQMIEAIKPDLDVSAHLSMVVLPAETMRAMIQANATDSRLDFRASVKRRIEMKLRLLGPEALKNFKAARRSIAATMAVQDPTVIDALLDDWLYENYHVRTHLPEDKKAIMEATYKRASQLKEVSRFAGISNDEIRTSENLQPPFLGHKPHWLEGYLGFYDHSSVGGLSYRSAVHPFWSGDRAYDEISDIQYLGADIEWRQHEMSRWNLLLAQVRSVENILSVDPHFSWMFAANASDHCLLCLTEHPMAQMSAGYGVAVKRANSSAYLFASLRTDVWEQNGMQGLAAPGLLGGTKFRIDSLTVLAEASNHWWQSRNELDLESRLNYAWGKNENSFIRARYEGLGGSSRVDETTYTAGWVEFF